MVNGFFDGNLNEIVSPLFGTNYWIGFCVSFFVVASLFVFKKMYAKVSYFNFFRYFLGSFQILLYILYYVFHQISGDITWKDYMPFHLCSLLDLFSAFVLLFPSEKIFSVTFPWIGPAIIPFLLTDATKQVYGLNSFFFYQYYLHHIIILFGYFYLYLYGHVRYNKLLLKQSCIYITIFALFVCGFNIIFDTNFLFIGSTGFALTDQYWFLNSANWNLFVRFLFMWVLGLGFIFLLNFGIVKFFPPFYFNAGSEINKYYQEKKLKIHKNKGFLQKDKSTMERVSD